MEAFDLPKCNSDSMLYDVLTLWMYFMRLLSLQQNHDNRWDKYCESRDQTVGI